ncbi:MAG: helix-turn-helix transcriptional regulator [Clostridiales Family XIII bacterium]|nr:helix-turn-helix transcriptional regulator [Clostridiales Family XIII bacterium]
MTRGTGTINLRNFTIFEKNMERMCLEKQEVISPQTLLQIKNAFDFSGLSLSSYTDKRFNGVEIIGFENADSIKSYYLNHFQKQDPFAAYINDTCADDNSDLLIQSSKVFGKKYSDSDYCKFLNTSGFHWAMAIPIDGYRLTLYRNKDEGDFSAREKDSVELLASFLRNLHYMHRNMTALADDCDSENQILDSMGIGFVSYDHKKRMRKCNQTAIDIMEKNGALTSQFTDLKQGYESILAGIIAQRGEKTILRNRPTLRMEFNHHIYVMETVFREDLSVSGYFISIFSKNPQKKNVVSREILMSHYGLTKREIDVADLLAAGNSYQKTAEELYISINTVRTHISNIYRKLNIDNQKSLGRIFQSI